MLYVTGDSHRIEVWERPAGGEWVPRATGDEGSPALSGRPADSGARLTGLVAALRRSERRCAWASGVAAEGVAAVQVARGGEMATVPVDPATGAFLVFSDEPGDDVVLVPLDEDGGPLGRPRRYQLAE
jgi:hypothetical protein